MGRTFEPQIASNPTLTLNQLRDASHKTAVDKGWWPAEGRNFGEMAMLGVSELAEAMEEARRPWFDPKLIWFTMTTSPATTGVEGSLATIESTVFHKKFAIPFDKALATAKPEGFPIEIADAAIRLLDLAGYYNDDLETAITCSDPECKASPDTKFHYCQDIPHLVQSCRAIVASPKFPDNVGSQLLAATASIVRANDLVMIGARPRFANILQTYAKIAAKNGFDLDDAIRIKMKYNESRPMRHGGKLA